MGRLAVKTLGSWEGLSPVVGVRLSRYYWAVFMLMSEHVFRVLIRFL